MATPDSSRGRPRAARAVPSRPPAGTPTMPSRVSIARAFGLALRELRIARGLSQEALADASGLDRTYPSLLERGVRTPTLLVIDRLARALGVPASELLEAFQVALNRLASS